jgi:hypothetical protein
MWADSLHVRTNIILFWIYCFNFIYIFILYMYINDAEFKSGVSLGSGRRNIPERKLTDSASESQVTQTPRKCLAGDRK